MKDYLKVSVRNKMTGGIVPVALEVLEKLLYVCEARDDFLEYYATFNHSVEQAEMYMLLLNKWDEKIKDFLPYLHVYCCASQGYSLN